MFERFTERARRVVVLAQEEARLLNHNYIGTEHLLLGLLREGEGVAATALATLEVSLERVRDEVEAIVGQGQSLSTGHIPFTPRAKKVLELSLREAIELHHDYIGTEHLLLGLLREGEGVAAQVLERVGSDAERLRRQVLELLGGSAERAEPEKLPRERGTLMATIRAAIRQELGRESAGPEDPEGGPLCPRCRSRLEATAAYRVLDLPPDEGRGETRAVRFAFCRRCGSSLGTLP